jgi:hypothetical protein
MWIKNNHGNYVNDATAVSGTIVESRGVRAVVLKDKNGDGVGTVREDVLAPPGITVAGPTPGIYIDDDGTVTARPIVAWRIGETGAEPVLHGERPRGHLFLHLTGNVLLGTGAFPELYRNLQAAVAAVTRAAATDQEEAA